VPRDLTDWLLSLAWLYFKPTAAQETPATWTTDDDPSCTITGTDDERIAFLRRTKSAAVKFGNSRKITFEDLWTANADKLRVAWPANPNAKSGLPYDASSADQAFFNHLAWGFGDNCDAMERVAKQGECLLYREKWKRPDYLRETILKAVALPKQWTGRKSPAIRALAPPAGAVLAPPPPLQAPQQVPAAIGEHVIPAPPAKMAPALPSVTINGKGLFEPTLDTVRRTLESDGLLSFDDFRNEPMLQHGIVRLPMTDKDYIDLRTAFEREKGFASVGKELMRDAVLAESQARRYDSGIEWLEAQVWDGVPRVERFMHTHFGAEDNEYTRAVGCYMWTGLAGRMFEPGCQLDMVIALQSKQGTGKSTGLKALAPDPDYFTDGLSLHEDNDNFKRLMRGKVVVEIAELAGLNKGDVNVVKRAITRTHEEWIEKYQTTQTKYARRCMLFASTNEQEFLPPDETGQRRWLPVVITEINRALVEADRAQLWAEGAVIWKASGIAYADAERLAMGRHKAHEQTDVWLTRIGEWLTATPLSGQPPYMRSLAISEVLEGALRMQPSQMDGKSAQRAGRVLRQLGYISKNVKIERHVVKRWMLDVPPPPIPR
jgi:hypothetical protein